MKRYLISLGLVAALAMTSLAYAAEEAAPEATEEAAVEEAAEEEVAEEAGEEMAEFDPSQFVAPPIDIPGEFEIETTQISIPSNGLNLDAILTVPVSDAEKYPMVILTHGFLGDYHDTENMSIALGKNGFASIRMSLAGSGESEGLYQDTTFTTQKEDVINCLEYAKGLDICDTSNLFLAGKSQGGFASANAAIDVEDEINAVCLFFPAFCIPDDFRSGRIMFQEYDTENVPDAVEMFPGYAVGKGMIEEGLAMDVFEHFPVIEKDVLIIHGDADEIVNISYSEKMAELYPSAELIVIPGGGHGFEGDNELKALADMVDFFKAHLQ